MHLHRLLARTGAAIALAAAFAATKPALAEQYVVQAGREWASLAPKLKPGDEVVLARGTHLPASFNGLSGSPFAPIVIRSSAPDQLAEIAADREAIKLVDCRHVRIERIAVRNARRAGILIESTKPGASLDLAISDVLVVGAKGLAEESGLVARGVRDIGIRRSRFENCVGCGILIDDCEGVTISEVQIASRTDLSPACAIRLSGRVWSTLIERSQIAGPIGTVLDIGRSESTFHAPSPTAQREAEPLAPSDAPSDPPAKTAGTAVKPIEPLVRFLVVANVRISGAHRLFSVGSAADSTIRNVTHRDAHEEVYRISAPPGKRPPVGLRLSECLVTWSPGALRQFGGVDPDAESRGLLLGPNLWWSNELPAALPLLGPSEKPFPGTIESDQILNIEPKFDARSRVITPEAKSFGAEDA
ncbi:MAG: right-handed parallel beta-helix repeat-containing protein [Planctomycetaceae bacterium]|nr:right-handed parallel beta-helix repeat-containing protein [Planctomycetaceae bacterium]